MHEKMHIKKHYNKFYNYVLDNQGIRQFTHHNIYMYLPQGSRMPLYRLQNFKKCGGTCCRWWIFDIICDTVDVVHKAWRFAKNATNSEGREIFFLKLPINLEPWAIGSVWIEEKKLFVWMTGFIIGSIWTGKIELEIEKIWWYYPFVKWYR